MGGGVVRGWLPWTQDEWALVWGALFTQSLLFFQTQAEAWPEEQVLPLLWKLSSGPWGVRAWTSRKVAPKPGSLSL